MRTMKTKKMILNAILLGIGLIVNQVFPAIGGGITPDITLVMLFCIMIINRDDYKTCLVAGIITGIFTAMTTKFPSGQAPNFIDKLVTVNVMYIIMKTMYLNPMIEKMGKKGNQIVIITMTLIGTVVSGLVFLSTASFMVGLPAPLMTLFVAVVVPATVINIIAGIVLFNIIGVSLSRTSYQIN